MFHICQNKIINLNKNKMTKNEISKAEKLIRRYTQLKNMIEEHTGGIYYDEMHYDIKGYKADLYNLDLEPIYIDRNNLLLINRGVKAPHKLKQYEKF